MAESDGVLLPHGGYEKLRSYQVAEAIYDATVVFCDRFIEKRSRTHDQMIQAARSGVRNISEGSGAAATSRRSEMKLTNVARASLNDELLKDFKSFLIQNGLRVWHKDSPEGLESQSRAFLEKGGFTENLHAARVNKRASDRSDESDSSDVPICGACGKPMRRRTASKGPNMGKAFWGCSGYPDCKATQPIAEESD